jgi:hypothetical protein
MFSITQESVPVDSLLKTFRGGARPELWGHQGDCFSVTVNRPVSLAEFVREFYSSPVFRVERLLLRLVAGSPSTDAQVRAVAEGVGESLAVWRVGARTETQLLMCDRFERTRSWFRVFPLGPGQTRLQFGSAVATRRNPETGTPVVRGGFQLLMRFHVLYSQILLNAAKRRIAGSWVDEPN